MSEVFLKIVNMSISAGWLVLAVLVLRLALRKAPKWVNPALWALVGLRLALPFSPESPLSLIPSAETIRPDIMMDPAPAVHTGVPALNNVVNPVIADSFTPNPAASANPLQILIPLAAGLWLAGMAVMLGYALFSYLHLRRRLGDAVRLRDNIYQSEAAPSPFVLGIFRPRIYLPFSLEEAAAGPVIAHEEAHLRRRDHWWKPLGYLLLSVHWFNPLCWAAYALLCRDIELACDERVIGALDPERRAAYSQALLSCAAPRGRALTACPLAFGEVGVKERVKRVLGYQKPAFWLSVLAAVACVIVGVCFLTNPEAAAEPDAAAWSLFDAVVLEPGEGSVLVRPAEDAREARSADKIYVSLDVKTDHPVPALKAGDRIRVAYDGFIQESYPAQIATVYAVYSEAEVLSGTAPRIPEGPDGELTQVWLDYYHSEEMPWDGEATVAVPAFPGVTFRWTPERVTALENGQERELFGGMPVWNVFFKDLTGDGKPELCATVSFGSGIVDDRVIVYDYAGGASYTLADRGSFDYYLSVEDGRLTVTKVPYDRYMSGEPYQAVVGRLVNVDGTIQIAEEETRMITPVSSGDGPAAVDAGPGNALPEGNLLRTYSFQGKEFTESARLSLYDSGQFFFGFSPISSYLGAGTYTVEDGQLIARTSDGKFTYVFDLVDDTLVFDGEASSDMVWFSGLEDGSVLQ